jgi:hypothetical protein
MGKAKSMKIKLENCDKFTTVDAEDYPLLSKWKWYLSEDGEVVRMVDDHGVKRVVYMANVVMGLQDVCTGVMLTTNRSRRTNSRVLN